MLPRATTSASTVISEDNALLDRLLLLEHSDAVHNHSKQRGRAKYSRLAQTHSLEVELVQSADAQFCVGKNRHHGLGVI